MYYSNKNTKELLFLNFFTLKFSILSKDTRFTSVEKDSRQMRLSLKMKGKYKSMKEIEKEEGYRRNEEVKRKYY